MEEILDVILSILVIIASFLGAASESINDNLDDKLSQEIDKNISQKKIIYNLNENLSKNVQVSFCPGCISMLQNAIKSGSENIKCAFYELDNKNIVDELRLKSQHQVNVELIIDDKYLNEEYINTLPDVGVKIYSDTKRNTRYNNYMHDKFCVIDGKKVITGSANPTDNGLFKNNNNMLEFNSNYIAKNYENEFEQMKKGIYGTNKISQLEYNNITLNYGNDSYLVSTYFCPQDDCLTPILNELQDAENEILFASFAFTHDDIASMLKMKDYQGINVSGILETRSQNLKGSDFKSLKNEFDFVLDTNKNTMHHKFFVIDGKTVVTGSMNPSASGIKYNDENVIIIENANIAKLYRKEFFSLIS